MGLVCSRRRSGDVPAPPASARQRVAAARQQLAASVRQRVTATVCQRQRLTVLRFKTAVRRVIHLLRLRKQWAAYGRVLQQQPRRDLWTGLVREDGRLRRARAAWIHAANFRPHERGQPSRASAETPVHGRRGPLPQGPGQSQPRTNNPGRTHRRGNPPVIVHTSPPERRYSAARRDRSESPLLGDFQEPENEPRRSRAHLDRLLREAGL